MQLIVTGDAAADRDDAVAYYELQADGLGFSFLRDLRQTLLEVERFPTVGMLHYGKFRGRYLNQFQDYKVWYLLDANRVMVIAIWHMRQDERRLLERISSK